MTSRSPKSAHAVVRQPRLRPRWREIGDLAGAEFSTGLAQLDVVKIGPFEHQAEGPAKHVADAFCPRLLALLAPMAP